MGLDVPDVGVVVTLAASRIGGRLSAGVRSRRTGRKTILAVCSPMTEGQGVVGVHGETDG